MSSAAIAIPSTWNVTPPIATSSDTLVVVIVIVPETVVLFAGERIETVGRVVSGSVVALRTADWAELLFAASYAVRRSRKACWVSGSYRNTKCPM